jgi:aerotaxis receptor
MRVNLPVTGREIDYDGGQMLVSMTDLKGRITHANDAFVALSGFTRDELIGKAHNLVRHPDMPAAAFADMWATIQAQRPWTALVKNRAKNGDHYWVRANATPLIRDGSVTGYLSVRVKPSRGEVDAAETLYRDMREGRAGGVRIEGGRLRHAGLRGLVERARTMRVSTRIVAALAAVAVAPAVGAGLGAGVWAVVGLCTVACVTAAGWLAASVGAPMARLRSATLRMAAADLNVQLDSTREDEIGDIFQGLTQTAVNLKGVVQDVTMGVTELTAATSEIASGSMDLSQRTEQQAAALEQTAASMEQLSATVKLNADNAKQANQLAQNASVVAVSGGDVVGQVVDTMKGINDSSRRIADIISVIDGIAFQTNILALNAAVEAARAGEQGRGFAVVASEVRSLAGRSAEAAKEIKSLIDASVERVERGSVLVDRAGTTMAEVVASIKRVTDIVAEISAASSEQSTGLAQVGEAVTQMDQVTQQNAALVEESAAASESLKHQAFLLSQAVSVFQLSSAGQPRAPSAATAQDRPATERRGPNRAKNVVRPSFKAKPVAAPSAASEPRPRANVNASAKTGTDDWESF